MSPRRAAVALAVVAIALLAANFAFTAHYVDSTQRAQQRAGEQIEQRLCATLAALTALKPPAGNHAYLQQEHARLAQLGTDIGCHGGPP